MRQIDRVDENYGEHSSDSSHGALGVAIDEAIVANCWFATHEQSRNKRCHSLSPFITVYRHGG